MYSRICCVRIYAVVKSSGKTVGLFTTLLAAKRLADICSDCRGEDVIYQVLSGSLDDNGDKMDPASIVYTANHEPSHVLHSGTLVRVIAAADQGITARFLIGSVGTIIRRVYKKEYPKHGMYEVYVRGRVVVMHRLDLQEIKEQTTPNR